MHYALYSYAAKGTIPDIATRKRVIAYPNEQLALSEASRLNDRYHETHIYTVEEENELLRNGEEYIFTHPIECENLKGEKVDIVKIQRVTVNVDYLLFTAENEVYSNLELIMTDPDDLRQWNGDMYEEEKEQLLYCLNGIM